MSVSSCPRVSVILPTHNRFDLFRRALASVLSQTCDDFEVWVVDNACSDGTTEYLASLGDQRVQSLRLDSFCGVSTARNAAIERAQGELLAFQDDDDIWLPDKLEQQLAMLDSAPQEVGLCLAGYIRLVPHGVRNCYSAEDFDQVDFSRVHGLVSMGAIATPAWLVRTELVRRVGGFDVEMPARNDWELALRLSDVCTFCYIEQPLFIQDQRHATSMASNEKRVVAGVRRVLHKHSERWCNQPATLASFYYVLGRYELTCGEQTAGREHLHQALALQPLLLSARVLLMLSWVGGEGAVRQLRRWRQMLRRAWWRMKTSGDKA